MPAKSLTERSCTTDKRPGKGRRCRMHQSNAWWARSSVAASGEEEKRNALSATLAFFDRRLCFITDKRAMIVFLVIQTIHYLVAFGPGRHFHEAESFGLPWKLIDDELGTDYTAELTAQLSEFRFCYIIRKATYKKLHAHFPWGKQQKLLRYRRI